MPFIGKIIAVLGWLAFMLCCLLWLKRYTHLRVSRTRRQLLKYVLFVISCCLSIAFTLYLSNQSAADVNFQQTFSNLSTDRDIPGSKTFLGTFRDAEIKYKILPADPKCRNSIQSDLRPIGIFVFSAPDEFEERLQIRQSWPRIAMDHPHAGVTFVLGLTNREQVQRGVEQESSEYKDILQVEVLDSYDNLSWKAFGLMKYAAATCSEDSMIFKTDVDVIVFLRGVDRLRRREKKTRKTIFGKVLTLRSSRLPHRDKKDKWYVSTDVFAGDVYPVFAQGPGYVMTGDVPKRIVAAAKTLDKYFPLEDVFITGIAAERANVSRNFDEGFVLIWGAETPLDICDKNMVILHRWTDQYVQKDWAKYLDCEQSEDRGKGTKDNNEDVSTRTDDDALTVMTDMSNIVVGSTNSKYAITDIDVK